MPRSFPEVKDFTGILLALLNANTTQFGGTITCTRRDDEIQVVVHTDSTGSQPGLRRQFSIVIR